MNILISLTDIYSPLRRRLRGFRDCRNLMILVLVYPQTDWWLGHHIFRVQPIETFRIQPYEAPRICRDGLAMTFTHYQLKDMTPHLVNHCNLCWWRCSLVGLMPVSICIYNCSLVGQMPLSIWLSILMVCYQILHVH